MAKTSKEHSKPKGSKKKKAQLRKPVKRKASTTKAKVKHTKQGKQSPPKKSKPRPIRNVPIHDGRVPQLPPTAWETIREGHRIFDKYTVQFRYYIGDKVCTKRQLMDRLKKKGIYTPVRCILATSIGKGQWHRA